MVYYEYDAWGNHAVIDVNGNNVTSGIGALNPFRYRGYYYDTETELYYLQTRYYDPKIGRFISQDSIEYADPQTPNGLNLYAYCNNNPVMGYDPDGTINWKKLFGWIIAIRVAVEAVAIGIVCTVFSFGATSPLLAMGLAALGGAFLGFASAFTSNIVAQTKSVGWDNVNFWEATKVGAIGAVIGAVSGVISFGIGQIFSSIGQTIGYSLSKMVVGGLEVSKVFSSAFMTSAFGVAGGFLGGILGSVVGDYYGNNITNQEYDNSSLTDTFGNVLLSNILQFITWIFGIKV